jgi:hypothetical protein
MTLSRRLLAPFAALALAAAAGAADAQNSATVTGNASATIVGPVEISGESEINFGVLEAGSVPSVVRVTSGDPSTRTVEDGDVTLLLGGGGFGPAEFTVTGPAGQGFAILVPTGLTAARTGGGDVLSIIAVNSNLTQNEGNPNVFEGVIGAGGDTMVRIGGDLSVPVTAGTGLYAGGFSISLFFQ